MRIYWRLIFATLLVVGPAAAVDAQCASGMCPLSRGGSVDARRVQPQSPPKNRTKIASFVPINAVMRNGLTRQYGGVAFERTDKCTYIASCEHGVEDETAWFVQTSQGRRDLTLLVRDHAADMTIFRIEARLLNILPLADAWEGDRIMWSGIMTSGTGYVASLTPTSMICSKSRNAIPGDSGSPVYNQYGLLGVLLGNTSDGLAVCPASVIRRHMIEIRDGDNGLDASNPTTDDDAESPSSPETPTVDVDAIADKIYDKMLENADAFRGPQGEPGKDGVDGKDGANGKDGVDGSDYALTDADKAEIADMAAKIVSGESTTTHEDHFVLVMPATASYSSSLLAKLAAAQEKYHKIRLVTTESLDVDAASVGALPQLVFYRDGTPSKVWKGTTNVGNVLESIRRETFSYGE